MSVPASTRITANGGAFGILPNTTVQTPTGVLGPVVNVKSFGAIGTLLSTMGIINASSFELTVTDATGWVLHAGIGVQGAGVGGIPLVARVTKIDGNLLTLDTAASVSVFGAVVENNDHDPIQEALDMPGATYVPAGQYVNGTPHAYAADNSLEINKPFFIDDNKTWYGDGEALSNIKVCDDAGQRIPSRTGVVYTFDGVDIYHRASAMAVNRQNSDWFVSTSGKTKNVTIFGLTLDGNKENQPNDYARGDDTGGAVPRPLISSTKLTDSVTSGTLITGHQYRVFITYTDGSGNETGGSAETNYDNIGTAFDVNLPPTPSEAHGVYIYVRDKDNSAEYFGPETPRFERQGPFATNLSVVTITDHVPGLFHERGELIPQPANSGSDYGISMINCDNWNVHDVEIKEFVVEGLYMSNVSNSRLSDFSIHDGARFGWGIAGDIDTLIVTNPNIKQNASGGVDIEPIGGDPRVLKSIQWTGGFVTDHLRTGNGIALVININSSNSTFQDCSITGVIFDNNFKDFLCGTGSATGVTIKGLTFTGNTIRNSRNRACQVTCESSGDFSSNSFDNNGRDPWVAPDWNTLAVKTDVMRFDGAAPWNVSNNDVVPCENGPGWAFISTHPDAENYILNGNRYRGYSPGFAYFASFASPIRKHSVANNTMVGKVALQAITTPYKSAADEAENVAIGGSDTSLDVVMDRQMAGNYKVVPSFDWDAGDYAIINQSAQAFTINWANAPGGGGSTLSWSTALI